jgi:hypothetical protein
VRSRQSRALLFALLAVFVSQAGLAACGGGDDDEDELTGLIVDVKGRGNDVRSFTLRTGDATYELHIVPGADYGYPLAHLRVHESSLFPVRCTFERRDGLLYALEIVDA